MPPALFTLPVGTDGRASRTRADGLDRRTGLLVLAAVYGAITLHMVAARALGGLSAVPFIAFGACQYAPALLTLLLVPPWRRRLVVLFHTVPHAGWLAGGYALTALTLTACVVLPYLSGHATALDGDLWRRYPLRAFVPDALHGAGGFVSFVLFAAPLLHLVNAVGEEVFWRGYLLDWLEARLPRPRAWLVDGLLWGVWHAPMIALVGWDFPGAALPGILAITAAQVSWSVVLCGVTRRSGSLWPAVLMHATANALTIGLYDRLVDHDFNLLYSPWGLLGGVLMALAALPFLRPQRAES
jgi:membrane protease YdiL (CAAX protease family)